jgi:chromosomal replication initiator protein
MKQLLYDLLSEELQVSLTPHKVIQHVAEHFGILSTDILGKSQSRDCALPRQISMYLCRHDLKLTYGKIGELFNKDHSTAISSVKVIQQHLDDNDCDVTTAIAAIQKKLKASPILSEATPYIQLVSDQVIC